MSEPKLYSVVEDLVKKQIVCLAVPIGFPVMVDKKTSNTADQFNRDHSGKNSSFKHFSKV